MKARAFLFLAVLTAWGARAAAAPEKSEGKAAAREHFQRGSKLFSLGHFKEAIAEYDTGYQLFDDPVFLYNIAQAHRLDGNPERALFFYRSYLSRAPNAPNHAEVQGRIAEMERLVAAQPPPEKAAPSPAKEPEPASAHVEPTAPAPTPTPVVERPASAPGHDGHAKKYAGIGLLAGGAAVVAVGIAMSVLAKQKADQLHADGVAGRPFDKSLESSGKTFDIVGPVLDAVGGAAAVAGAVLLTMGVREGRSARRAQLVPTGGIGYAGLSLSGAF